MSEKIKIVRQFSMLSISAPHRLRHALQEILTFRYNVHVQGRFSSAQEECFVHDGNGTLTVRSGFLPRIATFCRENRIETDYVDLTAEKLASLKVPADVYTPDWSRLKDVSFRVGQKAALDVMVGKRSGVIKCPTGWGKSWTTSKATQLLPKARFLITTRSVDVLKNLHDDVLEVDPFPGLIDAKHRVSSRTFSSRIVVCSTGCLHHVPPEWPDMLIADEVHEMASDETNFQLGRFNKPRFWGFTASPDSRSDGKDYRIEGLFGPIRLDVSYGQGVDDGLIVPIRVLLSDVRMTPDPAFGIENAVERNRHGLWTNVVRNRIVAADARRYGPDVQVLVTCSTIEHLLHLKRELPEFTMAYAADGIKPADFKYFERRGLIPPDYRPMTDARREKIKDRFADGRLKKVIVNTIFNRGVSFNSLKVLVRADGGASKINDVQIPGRTSRIDGDKTYGIIHDYKDQFNDSLRRRADGRRRSYESFGWDVVDADAPADLFSGAGAG